MTQLPNDDFTALVDNQAEYPPGDPDFRKEIETASQYGEKVLGTLCDILTITDEKGENMLYQYRISTTRAAAALINEFYIILPPENTAKAINAELAVGVNEDLNCRFPLSSSIPLTIPINGFQTGE